MLFSTAYMLWTVDGASHLLANIASSVVWLLVTSVLWVCFHFYTSEECLSDTQPNQGTAAGIMHRTRTGGDCPGRASISRFGETRIYLELP